MTTDNNETCRRCGCTRREHYAFGVPLASCHGGCGVDCNGFRDKGEDMSSINRLLCAIRRQAETRREPMT